MLAVQVDRRGEEEERRKTGNLIGEAYLISL